MTIRKKELVVNGYSITPVVMCFQFLSVYFLWGPVWWYILLLVCVCSTDTELLIGLLLRRMPFLVNNSLQKSNCFLDWKKIFDEQHMLPITKSSTKQDRTLLKMVEPEDKPICNFLHYVTTLLLALWDAVFEWLFGKDLSHTHSTIYLTGRDL